MPKRLRWADANDKARASQTFSTPAAAKRLAGRVTGLVPWQVETLVAHNGRTFRSTAVPAQHGPDGTEPITGPVTGFLVASDGLPTVYVSGDNASLAVVRSVAVRAHVDVAILFAGGAKSPRLLGDALLTLDGDGAAAAAALLPDARIVPVHFRGWSHFTQGADAIRASFTAAALSGRLHLLDPGDAVALSLSD
jgi:L-ascorbate metabolism protein UlaG (beta-lactamase superfamily)